MKGFAFVVAAAAAVALTTADTRPASAQSSKGATLKNFYGEYVGTGITRKGRRAGTQKRDRKANVMIEPSGGGGFKITWVTIRRTSVLGPKRKTRFTQLTFIPTGKTNRWRAKGNKPLDQGGPMAIATLDRKTLTVHVLALDRRGRIHAATYLRTLSRTGLHLVFRRGLNSLQVRRVAATLKRIKK
jgi:hypothetical protein